MRTSMINKFLVLLLSGFSFFSLFSLFFLFSCGDRPEKEKKPEVQLVGAWTKSIADCKMEKDCDCSDSFNFYDNNTFDRNNQCNYQKGSFVIRGDKLQLQMSSISLVYSYYVSSNDLVLIRSDIAYPYVRKPFKVRLAE